jgi:hypothetical protein
VSANRGTCLPPTSPMATWGSVAGRLLKSPPKEETCNNCTSCTNGRGETPGKKGRCERYPKCKEVKHVLPHSRFSCLDCPHNGRYRLHYSGPWACTSAYVPPRRGGSADQQGDKGANWWQSDVEDDTRRKMWPFVPDSKSQEKIRIVYFFNSFGCLRQRSHFLEPAPKTAKSRRPVSLWFGRAPQPGRHRQHAAGRQGWPWRHARRAPTRRTRATLTELGGGGCPRTAATHAG